MTSVSGMMMSLALSAVSSTARGGSSTSVHLGLAPHAGSATPAVLVDGILAGDVNWHSLNSAEKLPHCLQMHVGRPTRDVLFGFLRTITVARFAESMMGVATGSRHRDDLLDDEKLVQEHHHILTGRFISAVVCSSMSHDHFVKAEWGADLFAALKQCVPSTAYTRLHWHRGGHVQAFLQRTHYQLGAIHEVLTELHSL